jgi:hypothetical protein
MVWQRTLCRTHAIFMETQVAALRSELCYLKDSEGNAFNVLT